jgi:DNA-binding GntR family transcriptional regulator
MHTAPTEPNHVYDRLLKLLFSGELAPGERIAEQALARRLGVSRVPVREALAKLVGQGLLVGGQPGEGVRTRSYSPQELEEVYELRGALEGIAARAAARAASAADIIRMELICEEAETAIGEPDLARWSELDHAFHAALAEASHNERVADALKLVLSECHYLFYHVLRPKGSEAQATLESVAEDHRELLRLVREGDAEGAERKARDDMRKSAERAVRGTIARTLEAKTRTL